MAVYKGVVQNNVVVLEGGAHLPDGTKVVVRVPAHRRKRAADAFQHVLDNPITRPVGMHEIIEEDKREREERWDYQGRGGQ